MIIENLKHHIPVVLYHTSTELLFYSILFYRIFRIDRSFQKSILRSRQYLMIDCYRKVHSKFAELSSEMPEALTKNYCRPTQRSKKSSPKNRRIWIDLIRILTLYKVKKNIIEGPETFLPAQVSRQSFRSP